MDPSEFQIQPNPAKSSQAGPKKIKGKGFDFLGLSCPNRAFSKGSADPPGIFFLFAAAKAASIVAPVVRVSISFVISETIAHVSAFRKYLPPKS
jgi:hypothetical protein